MSGRLVTPKITKFQINPKIKNAIRYYTEALGLFEKDLEEGDQCTGYYAFKELCLMKEDLPSEDIVKRIGAVGRNVDYSIYGVYLFQKIHANLRLRALECLKDIRNTIKNIKEKRINILEEDLEEMSPEEYIIIQLKAISDPKNLTTRERNAILNHKMSYEQVAKRISGID